MILSSKIFNQALANAASLAVQADFVRDKPVECDEGDLITMFIDLHRDLLRNLCSLTQINDVTTESRYDSIWDTPWFRKLYNQVFDAMSLIPALSSARRYFAVVVATMRAVYAEVTPTEYYAIFFLIARYLELDLEYQDIQASFYDYTVITKLPTSTIGDLSRSVLNELSLVHNTSWREFINGQHVIVSNTSYLLALLAEFFAVKPVDELMKEILHADYTR